MTEEDLLLTSWMGYNCGHLRTPTAGIQDIATASPAETLMDYRQGESSNSKPRDDHGGGEETKFHKGAKARIIEEAFTKPRLEEGGNKEVKPRTNLCDGRIGRGMSKKCPNAMLNEGSIPMCIMEEAVHDSDHVEASTNASDSQPFNLRRSLKVKHIAALCKDKEANTRGDTRDMGVFEEVKGVIPSSYQKELPPNGEVDHKLEGKLQTLWLPARVEGRSPSTFKVVKNGTKHADLVRYRGRQPREWIDGRTRQHHVGDLCSRKPAGATSIYDKERLGAGGKIIRVMST
ncbi:hypothetical protein FNV43_RR03530 [Rhamnella rubrinervis]|uniref:Uncharacterized protein n=1 Tax=Rhamnella rubrinervis TaxID=2594499 RepID=A0A8K0MNS5_9ROSA|nr:hypothetical protein FNV43_RR03530 [Rhamnella rubrinervis]